MLINLRNALMAGKRLPYDAEVEYLESTGTQYIDTGRPIPTDFWFDATIDITGTSYAYKTLLGARVGSSINDYQYTFQSSNNYFLARYGNNSQYNSPIPTGMTHIRVESGGKLYINESFAVQLGVSSPSDRNMYIFALNNNGAVSQQAQYIRLYSLKYGGANEEYDFIPVRKGTVGYLYDRVTGKLFGNAGTGDFVLGQDVVPVEYIESHGTEYIDSGIEANQDLKIRAVFETNSSTSYFAYGVRAGNSTISCASGVGTTESFGYARWGTSAYVSAVPGGLVDITQDSSGALVNGTFHTYNATQTVTRVTGLTMVLFAAKNSTTTVTANMVGKFYSCKIWNNGILVGSFYPVRVGTEGAMMDVLTRRIYRNAGTGAFTYGNDLKYPIPAS